MMFHQLGALSPDQQGLAQESLTDLYGFLDRINMGLTTATNRGVASEFATENAQFRQARDAVIALEAQVESATPGDWENWMGNFSGLQAELMTLERRINEKISREVEGLRFRGLGWGLGAAAVAAGAIWLTGRYWRKRPVKLRRRR